MERNYKMTRLGILPMLLLLAVTSAWGKASTPTPSSILSQCVQACDCYQGYRSRAANLVVACQDMDDLPPIFPDRTTSLGIKNAKVPVLSEQLHQHNLRKLHDLDLAGNAFEVIAVDAFHDLPKLRFVNLANNAIAALSAAHFDRQRHLGLVDVSGNTQLDCFAFRREMAVKWPGACVKCDADELCDFTTGSDTSTVSTTRAPDLSDDEIIPIDELPEIDYDVEISKMPTDLEDEEEDDVEVVKLTRDWSFGDGEGMTLAPTLDVDGSTFAWIAVAGALGGALGACLVYVAVAVVRRLREKRPNGGGVRPSQYRPVDLGSSNGSIYAATTTPIPARATILARS